MATRPPGAPMMPSPTGGTTPPASVPLAFLATAGLGLIGFGFVTWFAADRSVVSPTHSGVVSNVHMGVLTFLTVGVLGALHQFAPVVGGRKLRSVPVAWITYATMVSAAWIMPNGFAHGPEYLVATGGVLGSIAVLLAAWNLSGPLSSRTGGVPLVGLRLSVSYLVVTVGFGVTYAFDRTEGWFGLLPHRVLAHAHLGLLGWLGLTYVSVAERLWPMFLLAHRPSQRSGAWAVGLLSGGTAVLATGLLIGNKPIAIVGGAIVIGGIAAHLTSLVGSVKHRRRGLELLHWFLFVSAGFLVTAVVLGVIAGLVPMSTVHLSRVVSAEVASLIAWLSLAIIGHVHKIVPFISFAALRAKGIRNNRSGKPLLFGDLYTKWAGWVTLGSSGTGFAVIITGLLVSSAAVVAIGGGLIVVAGTVVCANLSVGPMRARSLPRTPVPARPAGPEAIRVDMTKARK